MTMLKNMIRNYKILAVLFIISVMPSIGCAQNTLTTHTVSLALMPDVDYIKFIGTFERSPTGSRYSEFKTVIRFTKQRAGRILRLIPIEGP